MDPEFKPDEDPPHMHDMRMRSLYHHYNILAKGCGGWPSLTPTVVIEKKLGQGGQGRVYKGRPVLDLRPSKHLLGNYVCVKKAKKRRDVDSLEIATTRSKKWYCSHCRGNVDRRTHKKHILKFWNAQKSIWNETDAKSIPFKPAESDLPHLEILSVEEKKKANLTDAYVDEIKGRRFTALEKRKEIDTVQSSDQKVDGGVEYYLPDQDHDSSDEDDVHYDGEEYGADFCQITSSLSNNTTFGKYVAEKHDRDAFIPPPALLEDNDRDLEDGQAEDRPIARQPQRSITSKYNNRCLYLMVMLKKWQLSTNTSSASFDRLLKLLSFGGFFSGAEADQLQEFKDSEEDMSMYKLNTTLKVSREEFDDFDKFACCKKCSYPHPLVPVAVTEKWNPDKEAPLSCGKPLPWSNNRERFCNGLYYEKKKLRWKPIMPFTHARLKERIKALFQRPTFMSNVEHWRNRTQIPGLYLDVYDGRIWKSMERKGFFSTGSLAFMFSIDWFQPWKRTQYSVGVAWLVCLNLPREIRFKPENQIMVRARCMQFRKLTLITRPVLFRLCIYRCVCVLVAKRNIKT